MKIQLQQFLIIPALLCGLSASLGAAESEVREPLLPAHLHVGCEILLTDRSLLLNASLELHAILTQNEFKIVSYPQRAALLRYFNLDVPDESHLNELTVRFRESVRGYRMSLISKKNVEIDHLKFKFPPLYVWPVLNATKHFVDLEYENHSSPFEPQPPIPEGSWVGAILDERGCERLFVQARVNEGKYDVQLGVDLPESKRIYGLKPYRQRLFRTNSGWVRRTPILTLSAKSSP